MSWRIVRFKASGNLPHQTKIGNVTLKLYRNTDLNEFAVRWYDGKKFSEDRTYYTNQLNDAMNTMSFMANDIIEKQKLPTFQVIEYSSFFAVRHSVTGEEHAMGDGVDVIFDADEKAVSPGTPGFVETWASWLNESESETLEAYFPHLVEE
jgi:hypothetical protein